VKAAIPDWHSIEVRVLCVICALHGLVCVLCVLCLGLCAYHCAVRGWVCSPQLRLLTIALK
jgi:hypothetical protein